MALHERFLMIGVTLKEGEAIESALRRLKRECINAGVQSEYKRNEFYEKPSERKKRKRESAIRKRQKRRTGLPKRQKF